MQVTQLRGMLFEEAVLFLLRRAGYQTVNGINGDPTLENHGAGIAVVGRGAVHQIDAIADYLIGQPFSHPQRLLVEAKCFTNRNPVDLEVTRNAVGVLKDVSEYWSTVRGIPANHRRYHYQKAIFSATNFTGPAERYAFAHDIKLFPVGESECFGPVLDAIFGIDRNVLGSAEGLGMDLSLGQLRQRIRSFFLAHDEDDGGLLFGGDWGPEWVRYGNSVLELGGVAIGLVARSFPLFLVPSSRLVLDQLDREQQVRVRRGRGGSWTLQSPGDEVLFSFELPPVLFAMYAESGVLTRTAAAQMKLDLFSDLQAIIVDDAGGLRLVRFRLDPGWLDRLVEYAREVAAEELLPR